jgi:uncharacterized protein (TIGR02453 family)
MPNHSSLEPTLIFLDQLRLNNNKAWFDSHRREYDAARGAFEQLIEGLIDEFRASDHLQGLKARQCMTRIYRDIRFSKDKSPYKTNLGAIVGPDGWKPTSPGYYIHLEPHGQSMVAGGWYSPAPEQLDTFRKTIAEDASEFKDLIHARQFVETFGAVSGERLKTAPKGYDRAHPEIELLQLKQVTAIRRFTDQQVLADDFETHVVSACRAMRPFLDYLEGINR